MWYQINEPEASRKPLKGSKKSGITGSDFLWSNLVCK